MGGVIHIPISGPVQFILNRLKLNGYTAFIVGGAVRDGVRQMKAIDLDILTPATLDEIKAIFSDQTVKIAGRTFPVCLVNGVEVSSPRGAIPGEPLTPDWLDRDLEHRDLTINAMAWDTESRHLHDPFGGKNDLETKIIRFTRDPDQRIQEDPVRMVRACRFAAMLGGTIDRVSKAAIQSHLSTFDKTAAPERIRDEILKAMALDKPSLFFEILRENRLLERIFPCLDRCHGLDGGPYHGETVYDHCLLVGDALRKEHPLLRLAGFLHDTGKFDAAAFKDGRLTFAGHETHFKAAQADLEALRFSKKDMDYILALLQAHMRPLNDTTTPRAARRLLAMLNGFDLGYTDFMRLRIADKKSNLKKRGYTLDELKIRLQKLYDEMHPKVFLTQNQLKLTGSDIIDLLDIEPGPEVGRIKTILLEKVLDDPALNTRKALTQLCLSIGKHK